MFCQFLYFLSPWEKLPGMAPNEAGSFFFWPIQTLSTFWATWIRFLRTFNFEILVDSKFPGYQISGFPGSQIAGFPYSQISTRTAGRGAGGRTAAQTYRRAGGHLEGRYAKSHFLICATKSYPKKKNLNKTPEGKDDFFPTD